MYIYFIPFILNKLKQILFLKFHVNKFGKSYIIKASTILNYLIYYASFKYFLKFKFKI